MPTFCRHNRLEASCPICSRKAAPAGRPARSPAPRAPRSPSQRRSAPRRSGGADLRVRRVARAADDGYEHDLVPGLHATADAARLADELAFAVARLEELAADPPGLYADAARAGDAEEAAWLCFLISYLGPLEGAEDPFAAIAAARVPWASGEVPSLDGVETGPRAAHDPRRGSETVAAYRAWASRQGGQAAALAGDPSWTPQRRFERAFERLAMRGFPRGPRYDFLVVLGHLGLFDMRPWALQLTIEPLDPTVVAAKRVFGIGDARNLHERAVALARACSAPIEALDLALLNWSRPEGERITAGSRAAADPARREAIAHALGLAGASGS
ncbi:MAG TPA: hypothetical protein VFT42_06745 [Solirubrobacteraceae bacterium]|nr:hypothetical protein [Solirubrobacteraceae bacterium]